MFSSYPTYSKFRTLRLKTPRMRGEDVYALQIGLEECGFATGSYDGILGTKTQEAILQAQAHFNLVVDGLAGGMTQRAITLQLVEVQSDLDSVPFAAFKGQLELESGFRLGIYSPQRPDGHYDAGVAQRNTKYTDPEVGFDPQASIVALGGHVRKHYELFFGVADDRRRWGLAQGAWNAPAFACYLAREEGARKVTPSMTLKPSSASRETFEAYIAHASSYLPDN